MPLLLARAINGSDGRSDLYTYFQMRTVVSGLQRSAHGSVFDTITRDTFKTVSHAMPPIEISAVFDQAVLPLLGMIRSSLDETLALSTTRDALLPKLLSGQIRIKDAEKFVGDAA